MQGSSSLLTVKQVATALGIDERSVREKLNIGTLKGMKKTVGNKDQWFVQQRDLDAELARRGIAPGAQNRSMPDMNIGNWQQSSQPISSFTAPTFQPSDSPVATSAFAPPEVTSAPEEMLAMDFSDDITEVFAEVKETPEANQTTSGGERLSWLNEDMQQQLQMTAQVFMKPLVERLEALTAADKEKDVLLREKDRELEEAREQLRLLPDFEAQKAKLLKEIEAERQASEIQFAKIKEREQEAKVLSEENDRLRLKAEEAVLSAQKLADLEKVVQELQKPKPGFWQKMFGTKQ